MTKLPAIVCLLCAFAPFATPGSAHAGTVVNIGEIREFNGPDDLELNPDRVVVAIDVFGDADRLVNGVLFETDQSPPAGVSVTAANSINDWANRPSYSGADPTSADNLELIMQDIRWEQAPAPLSVNVGGLTPGIEYELQMLFNEGDDRDRRWDISIEGELAVDDFSSEGEGSWSSTNGFAYIAPFTLAPGDTTLNVQMAQHLGGQGALGSDNNPILQAFTVTEVTIPPTPESLALAPTEFFAAQNEPVGVLTTTDLKRNATHLYSFVAGGADNDKFEIDDDTIALSAVYDFSAHAGGTTFAVRVRTTDAEDPARFLEQDFTLTLTAPLAPTGLALSATSISLGAIVGTPVGQLSTTDPNAVDAHSYALAAGAGDADNALFNIDGAWLRLGSLIPAGRDELSLRVRSTDLAGLSFEQDFTLAVTEPSLRINEVMASNGSTLNDEDNESSDWIELFNEQAGTANLNGWYLTDDPNDLTKWQFPAVNIAANGYLVVFASGKDRAPVGGAPLHTNFQLGSGGEIIALVEPDGVTVADLLEFPEQYTDVSYGHNLASTEIGYLQAPSPGTANGDTAAQIANNVSFSHERGYYDAAFELVLTPSIEGSTIRYTTNGSKPTASSGSIYNGPITMSPETGGGTRGTRRVRAIAVHPSAAISPVATHTYLWVRGTGNPESSGVVGQSSFQSSIKNHAVYGPVMDEGLLALPAISIIKPGGMSGSEGEASLELFSVDGSEPGFQIECGMKIVGGASVGSPKNNFRVYFRSDYGAPKLRYPLFADHPYTSGGSEEFDVIQLRSGSHDNFYWMAVPTNQANTQYRPGDAVYIRNRWVSDVEMIMGHTSLHGRYVHCYLNGTYHGLYHVHERPMHHYLDKYFGGDPEDYHYTNSARTGSDHGGGDSWSATWSQVKAAASAGGQASRDWIDWESLADNQLLYFYCGNAWDWSSNHNWMAAGPKDPGRGGWRFYSWDCDVMLYDVTANNLGSGAPDGVFTSLMNDPDFRVFFRDRVYKHCFNEGVLRPNGVNESFDYRMNEIYDAIVPETARWQGGAISPPWDRDGEWQNEWNWLTTNFWPQRTGILLNQLRSRGWYPVDAPEFDPRGGDVQAGFSPVIDSGPGTIYVTTDGSDPRLSGGAVNPEAQAFNGSSITATLIAKESVWKYLDDGSDQGSAWRAPGFDDSAWASGPAELGYGDGVGGAEGTLVSYGGDPGDKHITTYFRKQFEVTGAASVTGLLLGLRRDDGGVVYLNGTEVFRSEMPLGAIGFDTLASNGSGGADETAFHLYGDVPPALLVEGTNTVAVEVHQILPTSSDISFDLELSATKPSDPSQFSLEKSTLVRARVLQGAEWSPLNEVTFTIGDAADATNLVISEFSYRPARPTAAEDPGGIYSATDFEFVELTNISAAPIHLADLRFTDGISFEFAGSAKVGLGPGESALVVESRDAFLARYPDVDPASIAGEYSGNLSNDGERVELLGTGDQLVRVFTYNDKAPWQEAADGDGYTLELIDPASNPDHDVATNWRASRTVHGTPAGDQRSFTFDQWQLLNFTEIELAVPAISGPGADIDFDGLNNFAEFALGTAPDDSISRTPLPEADVLELGGEQYLMLTYREWAGAAGVSYAVEVGEDLNLWAGGAGNTVEIGAPLDHGDGTVTRSFRSAQPITLPGREFIRLRMSDGG